MINREEREMGRHVSECGAHTHTCVDGGHDGKVDKRKPTYMMDMNWVHVCSNEYLPQSGLTARLWD